MSRRILLKNALVIGSSGGIGGAVRDALDADDHVGRVVALSRSETGLDITDEQSVRQAAIQLQELGEPLDLIFDATGSLEAAGASPEKSFRDLSHEAMATAFAVNAAGPAMLIKHFAPLLRRKERVVFATLSARVGSIEDNRLGGWMSYRASKAALNQLIKCASIEFARQNPEAVFVALHPGTIETALSRPYARGRFTAAPAEAAAQLLSVIETLTPEQSGGFFDYAGAPICW